MPKDHEILTFREVVWDYYRSHPRAMPWREEPTPYFVLVSELMLQQTQVPRVIPKFEAFIARFPSVSHLSNAPLSDVLAAWSGLGYNRRAKFLWQSAQSVMRDCDGKIPDTIEELVKLPGVGRNTAGAILAYAYNQPAVFVETNIRTVLLHHFFVDEVARVSDAVLLDYVAATLDAEHPREWYWALMDYGTSLKRSGKSLLEQSASHRKQAPLKGSLREMRGRIIAQLVAGSASETDLKAAVFADQRYGPALQALVDEGMVTRFGASLGLTGSQDAR